MASFVQKCIESRDMPILVVGLGRSGRAAALLLLSMGRAVFAVDTRSNAVLESVRRELEEAGASVHLNCERIPANKFACAVVSPGLSVSSSIVQEILRLGVRLLPEFELGWSQIGAPTVAVTGSNGKSTAVKLIAESMTAAGLEVALGGNYGTPLSEIALSVSKPDWLVAELSSFQLETHIDFRAEIALLLNLNANHLDRHGNMREYERIKMRIYENSRKDDCCIIPADMVESEFIPHRDMRWSTFGCEEQAQWRYVNGAVKWCSASDKLWCPRPQIGSADGMERDRCIDVSRSYFGNQVMGLTAAAVMAVCDAVGLEARYVASAAREFKGLPHRMELVDVDSDLRVINDSKATNLSAMNAALEMTDGPIRLIAGGRAKENDFKPVADLLRDKVAKAYLIGESRHAILQQWDSFVECLDCGDLQKAVKNAVYDASAGDTILLSPGCASFDQFHTFEERGLFFIKCIKALEAGSNL